MLILPCDAFETQIRCFKLSCVRALNIYFVSCQESLVVDGDKESSVALVQLKEEMMMICLFT